MTYQTNSVYFGYCLFCINLLIIYPNPITIIEPVITGVNKYSNDTDPIITIIGLPPAGGELH